MWNPFKAWRDSRRRSRFTKAFKQVLAERKGEMMTGTYAKCRAACDDKKTMSLLMSQFETEPGLMGGIQDWDWEGIMEWVQTFLIPLIKTLLPLLLLMDEE
jgi:hypothetical protein